MKHFRISFLLLLYLATVQLVNAQVKPEDIILLNQKIESQNQEIQSLKNRLSSETTQLKDKIDNYAPLDYCCFSMVYFVPYGLKIQGGIHGSGFSLD